MRHPAAAIVVITMVAAVVPGHAQRAAIVRAAAPNHGSAPDIARWQTILRIEDARDPTPADIALLVSYARRDLSSNWSSAGLHDNALRALGRFERLDLIPVLKSFLADIPLRSTAELALLLTLRAHAADAPDPLVVETVNDLIAMPADPVILGNLPLNRLDQFKAAEERLRAVLNDPKGTRAAAARGIEALARRNRKLGQLTQETVDLLEKGATRTLPGMRPGLDEPMVLHSLAALVSAGAVSEAIVGAAFREKDPGIRRLGALSLSGGASTIDASARADLIAQALKDRAASVRYEALRAWIRRESSTQGCGPILDALGDEREFVVLAAVDALGERCLEDESITARLVAEARMPPNNGRWHREAHALVALARRAPDLAASAIPGFARHLTWQVRMYAARAASVLKDADTLALLAYDANDNVRHAALPPLRVLTGADSDVAFVAALARDDYQLLRTVAITLKGSPPSKYLLTPLIAAFDRVTSQKKDTSRDTRVALLEAIVEQGGREIAWFLDRLLTDYDPGIVSGASAALNGLTGKAARPAPRLLPRPPPPSALELQERLVARVDLETGGSFDIVFDKEQATLAYTRFARLARAQYFDGLTFHRIAPNFVIQGGSPRANEYAGDAFFMRDELTTRTHAAGTVGTSTRGRDTGDAQFFINLVDNRTLEFEYTVFGRVANPRGGADVESILEGTQIRRIRMVPPVPPLR